MVSPRTQCCLYGSGQERPRAVRMQHAMRPLRGSICRTRYWHAGAYATEPFSFPRCPILQEDDAHAIRSGNARKTSRLNLMMKQPWSAFCLGSGTRSGGESTKQGGRHVSRTRTSHRLSRFAGWGIPKVVLQQRVGLRAKRCARRGSAHRSRPLAHGATLKPTIRYAPRNAKHRRHTTRKRPT